MKTVIEMAREAGFWFNKYGLLEGDEINEIDAVVMFERFAELVRADAIADERELLSERIKELEHQAARYKVLRTWDLGGYDHGLYSPEEVDKAVDDCIKEKNNG